MLGRHLPRMCGDNIAANFPPNITFQQSVAQGQVHLGHCFWLYWSNESGPHATLFYLYLKTKQSGRLWSPLSFHLGDLLGPSLLKASAVLSVESSLYTRAYTLSWTDTIDVSPVQMDFSMIAQRTAKDNCSPNLISTKRWWALFWLPWLTVRLHVDLLRSNGISLALSARLYVHIIFHFRPPWLPSVGFI